MPIAAAITFLKGLLDGIGMPAGTPDLAAYITPPDPNVESQFPTCYIMQADGPEQRLTMPRNLGPNTSAGGKTIQHQIRVHVIWFLEGDDPEADTLFPGICDGIMSALRTAWPMPAILTDPYTGAQTQAVNAGENMRYEIYPPSATRSQRWNRYDGVIFVPVLEKFEA